MEIDASDILKSWFYGAVIDTYLVEIQTQYILKLYSTFGYILDNMHDTQCGKTRNLLLPEKIRENSLYCDFVPIRWFHVIFVQN